MRTWKKMREEGARHRDETSTRAVDTVAADNPWADARPTSGLSRLSEAFPTLEPTGRDGDPAADRYRDWATRMHEKRRRVHQDQIGQPAPSYWTTDALFEESRRVEHDEIDSRPNPWRVQELLSTLDLREGASHEEIGDAYRRLAKEHHPDHFVGASAEVQEFHAERMRAVISAYRALRQLQKT
jgi:hypothetical protein